MAIDPNAKYHLPAADYARFGHPQAMWMEARLNAIMPAITDQPDVAKAMKHYTALVAHSNEVPREKRQQARMKPVQFAEATLVNFASCIALEEFQNGQEVYSAPELRARIRQDLASETSLVTDSEKQHGGGRAH